MPVHDWSLVEAGIFHAFHASWVPEIQKALNGGVLPGGYYALAEQHAGRSIADVLTLHASPPATEPIPFPPTSGGTAVAEAPPRVRFRHTVSEQVLALRRTLAIRHVSGHRLVAILEIISPANKDRPERIEEFATKIRDALDAGVNAMVVDVLPPVLHDPAGMPAHVRQSLDDFVGTGEDVVGEPLSVASFAAGPRVEVYLERFRVGSSVPEMPLFIGPERYVTTPLETTYQAAYVGLPGYWRGVLEGSGIATGR